MASVKRVVSALDIGSSSVRAMNDALAAIQTDLTALQTAITGITAQLDADAGVTDTDYAANNDPTLTLAE